MESNNIIKIFELDSDINNQLTNDLLIYFHFFYTAYLSKYLVRKSIRKISPEEQSKQNKMQHMKVKQTNYEFKIEYSKREILY